MIQGVALIILSAIAASSFLLNNKFQEKYFSSLVVPIQGLFGFIHCIWGLYSIIVSSYSGLEYFQDKEIYAIAQLLVSIMQIIIGYLLGYNLISISIFVEDNSAKTNNSQLLSRWTPVNETVGIVGMITGLGSTVIYAFC